MAIDREEKHFELLLSEKQHADSAIVGYADLHVKLFALFGAGITVLGWLYGEKGAGKDAALPTSAGIVALTLVVISCGIVVHGVSTYALTLGYIQYKNEVLNPAFRDILALKYLPLGAVKAWATHGAARRATIVSSLYLFFLHKLVASALLVAAAYSFYCRPWSIVLIVAAWFTLMSCVIVEAVSFRSIVSVLLKSK